MSINEKGKTRLQERQERLAHLKEIYFANKSLNKIQLERLFTEYLTFECGLGKYTMQNYLEWIHSFISYAERNEAV